MRKGAKEEESRGETKEYEVGTGKGEKMFNRDTNEKEATSVLLWS